MKRTTQLSLFERPAVDVKDDPALGYCKVYRWTRKQRETLERYRRGVDYTGNGQSVNGNPMQR